MQCPIYNRTIMNEICMLFSFKMIILNYGFNTKLIFVIFLWVSKKSWKMSLKYCTLCSTTMTSQSFSLSSITKQEWGYLCKEEFNKKNILLKFRNESPKVYCRFITTLQGFQFKYLDHRKWSHFVDRLQRYPPPHLSEILSLCMKLACR